MPLPPPPKPAPWSSLSGEERARGSDRIESAADAAAGPCARPRSMTGSKTPAPCSRPRRSEGPGRGMARRRRGRRRCRRCARARWRRRSVRADLVKTSISEPRVFVHYTASAAGARPPPCDLVRRLRAAGFAVEGRAVEFSIPEDSIRYFFDGDRDEAKPVAPNSRARFRVARCRSWTSRVTNRNLDRVISRSGWAGDSRAPIQDGAALHPDDILDLPAGPTRAER